MKWQKMMVITGQLLEAKHRCGGFRGGELRDESGALKGDDMLDAECQDINKEGRKSLSGQRTRGISSELQVWCANVK